MKSGSRGFRPLQGRAPWFSAAARLQQLLLRLGRPAGGPRSRILNAIYTEPRYGAVAPGGEPRDGPAHGHAHLEGRGPHGYRSDRDGRPAGRTPAWTRFRLRRRRLPLPNLRKGEPLRDRDAARHAHGDNRGGTGTERERMGNGRKGAERSSFKWSESDGARLATGQLQFGSRGPRKSLAVPPTFPSESLFAGKTAATCTNECPNFRRRSGTSEISDPLDVQLRLRRSVCDCETIQGTPSLFSSKAAAHFVVLRHFRIPGVHFCLDTKTNQKIMTLKKIAGETVGSTEILKLASLEQ